MRKSCWAFQSFAFVLVMAGRGIAQETELADRSLAGWIEALKDGENPKLRIEARRALGPEGPFTKVAVPALIEALKDLEQPVGSEALETLADHGPPVVPILLRALKRPEPGVRAGVVKTLGYVRPKAREAVPALIDAMTDSAPKVRVAACSSIDNIGQLAYEAVPSLIVALQDHDDSVRDAAALALRGIGRRAKPAVPTLIVALKDKDANVRQSAAWALEKIGRDAKAVVPALIAALKDKDGNVRQSAAQALGKIGPDAKAAVPALIEAIRDKNDNAERWKFAQALGGIGPAAKEAVPALVEALQGHDDDLHLWAGVALGEIGPNARAAVPALIKVAGDKRNPERDSAIAALGKIGPDAKAAIPTLIEALATRKPYDVSYQAAIALGRIGPDANSAIPALTAIVRDQFADSQCREAAAMAVIKIDPELAARQGMETAHLSIRLGKVPSIQRGVRSVVTEEQEKQIKALIAKLAEIEDPDFGMSPTFTGHAFAPLPDQDHWQMGRVTDHQIKSSHALRRLVEIGPDALPFLLEALEDKTPTKLKIAHQFGFMALGNELDGNPLNPVEKRILSKPWTSEEDEEDGVAGSYTVKVGDVCFVAIGQIVGRPYRAVRYQPTAMIVINSPVESKELCRRVRALWSSKDPAQKLFDSLLLDYTTEGIFNGDSLDGWSRGSDFQIQAVLRWLYYFPKETAPVIAGRLRSFDVRDAGPLDGWMKREVKNGVRLIDFIKAVSWCKAPAIQEALADIAKRTDDPEIKKAVNSNRR
jgi:HEAT repeat protein